MKTCLKIGVENELFSISIIVTIIFALILLLLFMLSYV